MNSRTLWFSAALIAAMGFLVLTVPEQSATASDPAAVARRNAQAANQVLADECVKFTRPRLHDPDSAKLPDALSPLDYPERFYVGERKKGIVTVQFEMRAKNGFNATRAYMVNCDFKRSKDGYNLVDQKSWQR